MNPSINLAKVCVFVCVISPQIHIGSSPNFQHMPYLTKEKIATLINPLNSFFPDPVILPYHILNYLTLISTLEKGSI